ncbi:HET-domain-containing protein [Nemania sp. FL0916]|nr:HET-domain-containing protein [Nemania sp. FL0916]
MSDTIYTSLEADKDQIRILELLPGDFIEPIRCRLLVESTSTTYEALSYVWGDVDYKLTIDVQGQQMPLTRNLESGLRHIRRESEIRRLWVDALCINQDDLLERRHQIGLMGRIYKGAERVIVWLGPERIVIPIQAIQAIRELGSGPGVHWNPATSYDFGYGLRTLIRLLLEWTNNDWYKRIWTVQEEILAKSLVYKYGSFVFQSDEINRLIHSYHRHFITLRCCDVSRIGVDRSDDQRRLREYVSGILRMISVRNRNPPYSFLEIASSFRSRMATDPHDKIFGIIGLTDDLSPEIINYESSMADLYTQTAFELIQKTGNLDIFSHASLRALPQSNYLAQNLPSWVPDWSPLKLEHSICLSARQYYTNKFNACSYSSPAHPKRYAQTYLGLRGLVCDAIAKVGARQESGGMLVRTALGWRYMAKVDQEPDRLYVSGSTIFDAYWRTLCMDIVMTSSYIRRADERTRIKYDEWSQIFQSARGDSVVGSPVVGRLPYHLRSFDRHVRTVGVGRRLFLSKRGYLGLAPGNAKVGDEIWVLDGGRLPLILRPSAKELHEEPDPEYSLVGDAYVHGIMDGEVVEDAKKRGIMPTPVILK